MDEYKLVAYKTMHVLYDDSETVLVVIKYIAHKQVSGHNI